MILKTITLEVADLPRFSLGSIFQNGATLTNISIIFSISNISTTYTVKSFSFNSEQRDQGFSIDPKEDEENQDEDDDLDEPIDPDEPLDFDDPPELLDLLDVPEFDPEEEIFKDKLTPPQTDWLYRLGQPQGGVGVITGGGGGGRYDISRLDSQFGGGISSWNNVPNLSENAGGGSFLPNGTRVQITLYDTGRFVPSTPGTTLIGENEGGDGLDDIEGGIINGVGSTIKKALFSQAPGSFQATVIGGGGGGIYNVTRAVDGLDFSAQNTAEKDGSPGFILPGTRVDLQVDSGGVVFFNQTPTVFAIPESEE